MLEVNLSYRPILLGQSNNDKDGKGLEEVVELRPVKQRMLAVPADTLLCSLDHEIELVVL